MQQLVDKGCKKGCKWSQTEPGFPSGRSRSPVVLVHVGAAIGGVLLAFVNPALRRSLVTSVRHFGEAWVLSRLIARRFAASVATFVSEPSDNLADPAEF